MAVDDRAAAGGHVLHGDLLGRRGAGEAAALDDRHVSGAGTGDREQDEEPGEEDADPGLDPRHAYAPGVVPPVAAACWSVGAAAVGCVGCVTGAGVAPAGVWAAGAVVGGAVC